MTTQHVVKDSWSGRQIWWFPSTLTAKLLQQQNLVKNKTLARAMVTKPKGAMEHDVLQY